MQLNPLKLQQSCEVQDAFEQIYFTALWKCPYPVFFYIQGEWIVF